MKRADAYAGLETCTLYAEQLPGLASGAGANPLLKSLRLTDACSADLRHIAAFRRLTHLRLNCFTLTFFLKGAPQQLDTAALAGHPNLQVLTIYDARINAAAMAALALIPGLSSLDLTDSRVEPDAVAFIPVQLVELALDSSSPLLDEHTVAFAKMHSLLRLRLEGVPELTDACKSNMPAGLLSLKLAHSRLTSTAYLPCLGNLEELLIESSPSLVSLEELDSAVRLKLLALSSSGIRDRDVRVLSGLHNVEFLDLSRCALSDEAIPYLPPNVRVLNLSGTGVTRHGLLNLPPGLAELDVSHCGGLDDLLVHALENMHSLVRLRLTSGSGITAHGVRCLQHALPGCLIDDTASARRASEPDMKEAASDDEFDARPPGPPMEDPYVDVFDERPPLMDRDDARAHAAFDARSNCTGLESCRLL